MNLNLKIYDLHKFNNINNNFANFNLRFKTRQMEVTIKNYDLEVTIKSDNEGLSTSELFDMFNVCMLGITFQQCQLDEYIIEKAEELLKERINKECK